MCHAHVHHHRQPREVHEEVSALVITLGSRRGPCRSRGAVVVCGSNNTEGVG